METRSYTEFSHGIQVKALLERIPLNGTIEITHRCPLRCAHCYNNLAMDQVRALQNELTLEEHIRILDEIAEAGCLWLLFTGGEVFARRDFLDIYSHAKRKGFIITIFTNGTLITPRIADRLAEERPFAIEITLYGRTRETYERLTGIRGSYDRCLRGIRLLLERRLPLRLKAVAVTVNRHEILGMKRFAESLGVEFKFDAMMNPRIDCSHSPLGVRLSPDEVVELDLQDGRRREELRRFVGRTMVPAGPSRGEVYRCGGGVRGFSVDPEGKMGICILSQFHGYDLRNGSFREGWGDFLLKVRGKKITRLTKCSDCQIKSLCGMCPANGELENGDPEAPVDFFCHVAHLRAKALGFSPPPHGVCEYCGGDLGFPPILESDGGQMEPGGCPGCPSTTCGARERSREGKEIERAAEAFLSRNIS